MVKAWCIGFLLSLALIANQAFAARIPLYVVYDPVDLDYFYTLSPTERDAALMYGYTDQGIAFYVEAEASSQARPFRRFYKGAPQYEHFYTIDDADVASVLAAGWADEGNEGYVFAQQVTGSVPVYRLSYYNASTGDLMHHYTIVPAVAQSLSSQGWTNEGIKGYAFTRPGVADSYKAAILLYHMGEQGDCTGYSAAPVALERDQAMLRDNGFTVVPVRWMVDWALGLLQSEYMPSKPVALTFDDGYDLDYYNGHPLCPQLKSARTVLNEMRANHPSLFASMPAATSFVIASPRARSSDTLFYLHDSWWASAQAEGVIEIQNHSADHDSSAIHGPLGEYDPAFGGVPIAMGGLYDGNWTGADSFCRIGQPGIYDPDGTISAYREIVLAANYIQSKTGVRPDLFSNPVGGLSTGLKSYLQNYASQHGVYAAFPLTGQYVQRGAHSRYEIPRFSKGTASKPIDWYSSEFALLALLNGGGREVPTAPPGHVTCP